MGLARDYCICLFIVHIYVCKMLSLRTSTDELISSVGHPSRADSITPHFPCEKSRDKDRLRTIPKGTLLIMVANARL